VGHLGRVRRLREALARHPGLYVAGSGFEGVGIPDCVKQAEAISDRILAPTRR
jgi:oxygen-dependent protoporphyrinogen oxidase